MQLRKSTSTGKKTAVQRFENIYAASVLLSSWISTHLASPCHSETKLRNGRFARDHLGCNDSYRCKHGETAVVQFKISHIRVVSQWCTGLKRVAEIPYLFVRILLPKNQLEST